MVRFQIAVKVQQPQRSKTGKSKTGDSKAGGSKAGTACRAPILPTTLHQFLFFSLFTFHLSPPIHLSPPLSLGCQEIIGFTTHANLTDLPQNGPNPANSDGVLTILPYTDGVLTKRKQMLEGRAPFRAGRFKNGQIRGGRSKPRPYLTTRPVKVFVLFTSHQSPVTSHRLYPFSGLCH